MDGDLSALPKTLAPLVLMTALRQLDAEDPFIQLCLRLTGAVLLVLIIIVMLMIWRAIPNLKDGKRVVKMKASDMEPPSPMAAFLPQPESETVEPEIEMTFIEFDKAKWNAEFKKMAMQSVIITGMHLKWGYMVPIVISPTMALLSLCTSELFQIHIQGRSSSAHPKLLRPWGKSVTSSSSTTAASEPRSALLSPDEQKSAKKTRKTIKKDE